ncbi:hypothetical protein [Psychrobacter sp. ANT_WB68]|uniref:hypothetical protein n=1 Tax=Psychrobacter sp. ANT_WB68 TaxID=2597355 RepID=UPI0011F147FC|nr:hypothetical protein [Psychrobacter sp. ANT_WB68]KAA0914483.1 hypothetical protein FQ084_07910 [Psychrobacter sp. ANT_WB68]
MQTSVSEKIFANILLSSPSYADNSIKISKEAASFAALPLSIQNALKQNKRIVFIANNPSIGIDMLEHLLRPDDVLVLFNHFIYAEFFANHPLASTLPKLLFFRQIGDSKLHFGLPPRSNNVSVMKRMAEAAPLGILLSNQPYQFPLPSEDPSPDDDPIDDNRTIIISPIVQELLQDEAHHSVLSERHLVVADYPYFTDIHSSAPSSGFLLYRLVLAAREHVQLMQKAALPLQLLMIGFNDNDKTAHFWQGHNWEFERREMSSPPLEVEIIRQY